MRRQNTEQFFKVKKPHACCVERIVRTAKQAKLS